MRPRTWRVLLDIFGLTVSGLFCAAPAVKSASPGNTAVQFRSRYDASATAPNGGWLDGPQVDIHPPAPFRRD
jgi:hypothetical protein